MQKALLMICLLIIGTFLDSVNSAVFGACRVVDGVGQSLYLAAPAKRIISLDPGNTELLFAVGAGPQVIGVESDSNYPLAAKILPKVGNYSGIDLERVMAMHPDLVVAWDQHFAEAVAFFKRMGMPVYVTKPTHLADIPRTMENLGCLTGHVPLAHAAAEQFSHGLAAIKIHRAHAPIKVFYELGSYSLITINQSSWISEIINLCGGVNIFAQSKLAAPSVDLEAVLAANPAVILNDAADKDWQAFWQRFQGLAAVSHHHLATIDADTIERPGPRLLAGARQVCAALARAAAE